MSRKETAGSRSMALGFGDRHTGLCLTLKAVVSVDEQLQLPVIFVRQLGTQCFKIRFDFSDVSTDCAFRMARPRFAPVEVAEIAGISRDCFECPSVIDHNSAPDTISS